MHLGPTHSLRDHWPQVVGSQAGSLSSSLGQQAGAVSEQSYSLSGWQLLVSGSPGLVLGLVPGEGQQSQPGLEFHRHPHPLTRKGKQVSVLGTKQTVMFVFIFCCKTFCYIVH